MKKPYCCDASRDMYQQYYSRQQQGKGDFPVYVGSFASQRGHGIGNIIGSIFRRILPELKILMPHALRTGANMFDDVQKGKTWKQAARARIPEGLSNLAFGENNQSGSGASRVQTSKRKKRRGKKSNKQSKSKRRKRDIFS
jgi:hypothetical protein